MTSVIRYKRDPRQFSQEAFAHSNDLVLAKLHELSGDLKAAALHYRQAAKLAFQNGAIELSKELHNLADEADRFNWTEID